MDIAIIGTGNIGATLARHWHRAGHTLRLGSRSPSDSQAAELAREVAAEVSDPAAAAAAAQVIALAIPGPAVIPTAQELGAGWRGKTVVVPANHMQGGPGNLAAAVAEAAPGCAVIRAFNTIGFEVLAAAEIDGEQVDMLYACSEGSEPVAEQLISDCGLRPIAVGGLEQARLLDDLFQLWVSIAFGGRRGRGIAFALRGG